MPELTSVTARFRDVIDGHKASISVTIWCDRDEKRGEHPSDKPSDKPEKKNAQA